MGINGLLKQLSSISNKKHISEYMGKRVAIDGYGWLHKSIFRNKFEIIENPNSTGHIAYLIRKIESLLNYSITPVIVFDGDKLPMKKKVEEKREKKRDDNSKKAEELYAKGLEDLARQKLIESIDINPKMVYMLIQELKKRDIEYFVAPYEADAQLAYLLKIHYVDLVISEDADMVAFGCNKVLFKFDWENGIEINLSDIRKCSNILSSFTQDQFLYCCILSGCDYFKIRGIGMKKALNLVQQKKTYQKIFELLRNRDEKYLPKNVEDSFEKAFLTFKFQVIYCPIEKRMKYFSDIEDTNYHFINSFIDKSFLGKIYDEDTTHKIVYGIIDPITHLPFEETTQKSLNAAVNHLTENNLSLNENADNVKKFRNQKVTENTRYSDTIIKDNNFISEFSNEDIEKLNDIFFNECVDNKNANLNELSSQEIINKLEELPPQKFQKANFQHTQPKQSKKRKNPFSQDINCKYSIECLIPKKFKLDTSKNKDFPVIDLDNEENINQDKQNFEESYDINDYKSIIYIEAGEQSDFDINKI